MDPIQCCYGYLATALIAGCRRLGVFERLAAAPSPDAPMLADALGLSAAPLQAVLHSLHALGWLQRGEAGTWRLVPRALPAQADALGELIVLAPADLRAGTAAQALAELLHRLPPRTGGNDSAAELLASGALNVLIVALLRGLDSSRISAALKRLEPALAAALQERFVTLGWLDEAADALTPPAVDLLHSPAVTTLLAYRPLLAALDDILRGDAQALAALRIDGSAATRLDRALAFGAVTRADLLDDLQADIAALFATAGPACSGVAGETGDALFAAVAIAADETAAAALPRITTDAAALYRKAQEAGAQERLLLVHSGLERGAADALADASLDVLAASQPAYLAADGSPRAAVAVLSGWQHELQRWAGLDSVAQLLWLQPHAVPAGFAADGGMDDAALQGLDALSGRELISAEAFLCLAARCGWFSEHPARRYPVQASACSASLHLLGRRAYRIRHAVEQDLPRLCELENLCWQHTQSPQATIRARISDHPQGQFVLERDGQVLGVVYSQRIAAVEALNGRQASNVHELHRADGAVVQLLAVNVDPQVQNLRYGDQLLEFMLQRCSLLPGVKRVVGVTLCKRFDVAQGEALEDYIRRSGAGQDPVLAFHHSHGGSVVRLMRGYRPDDAQNQTHGVLVSYDILARAELLRQRAAPEESVPAAQLSREHLRGFLCEQAQALLQDAAAYADERPFMEMGLDSAGLLQLQQLLERECGQRLPSAFFFEFNSVAKVAAQLGRETQASAAPVRVAPGVAPVAATAAVRAPASAANATAAATAAESDIAVIGVSCRLPGGVDSPVDLWNVLAEGRCVIGAYPQQRGPWPDARAWPGIDQGGFVSDAAAFDAAFFRISPAEAQLMDPQQRLVLQLAWSCLEDANLRPADIAGSAVGVFVGASNSDYSRLLQDAGVEVEAHLGVASSLAVIANRVSYFFDLCGPSLLIDTACSSSLVALHTAVQSLRRNECSSALVGGVNLICHPDLSLAYHKAGMLAADGRCKVFDARANGYVRAEGAVMLLLKPLRRALADGDRVHAVIKGSAVNHGGLASGLTVPNPVKQRELLLSAWDDAGVRAGQLSYIEAHGTGTSLGDPIEVQGIRSAYAQRSTPGVRGVCALGSLKSNLGHLESAAGLAGVLKVILSLQQRQLPPTVNFSALNPKIELGDALQINDSLRAWNAPQRLAGVSSFGSGGANAHVVIGEFVERAHAEEGGQPQLFVLSAPDRERLRAYAQRVLDWCSSAGETDFGAAIRSWQLGRTAMKTRLALKVSSLAELHTALTQWLAGKQAAQAWSGDGSTNASAALWQTRSGRQLIEQALHEKDLDQLGLLWTSGIDIDWAPLHRGSARRAGVPTYPFAREDFWIPAAAAAPRSGVGAPLHPLLHANVSDLSRQCFRSLLSGSEFFLADHKVRLRGVDEPVLPAVAYLEMARAAVEQATPAAARGAVLELRNSVWALPMIVRAALPASIMLAATAEGEIDFAISSGEGERSNEHCQGRAAYVAAVQPETLDIAALTAQMDQGALDADAVYAAFERMGLVYGPAHRAVRQVLRGNDALLAQLELPDCVRAGAGDFVLHPSLMDGALQACIGLAAGAGAAARLPFALDTLRVFGRCPAALWAWVRVAAGSSADAAVSRLDIDLCDAGGKVCVQLRGFSTRAVGQPEAKPASRASGLLLAVPRWSDIVEEETTTSWAGREVILCGLPAADTAALQAQLPGSRCSRWEDPPTQDAAQRYEALALACFAQIQEIFARRPAGPVLLQLVLGDEPEQALCNGLSALFRTAHQENPLFRGQIVQLRSDSTAAALVQQLQRAQAHPAQALVRFAHDAQPQALGWREQPADATAPPAYKEHGVYLITGGLGGLGCLFARDILGQAAHAQVILTGRGEASGERRQRLEELQALAPGRVHYRSVDLAATAEVSALIDAICATYGTLHGILHSAGMIADSFIVRKTAAEFRAVLQPKVAAALQLDTASAALALDFFVLFSSTAGAFGNVGQADYAAANGFLDQFAQWRSTQVQAGRRHGRTLAINWPLWRDGGMQLAPALQAELERTTGMQPLDSANGLRALHYALAQDEARCLVLQGRLERLQQLLQALPAVAAPAAAAPVAAGPALEGQELRDRTQDWLRRQFSQLLKLSSHRIDPQAPLEQYGIDSILAMRLTGQLEKTFGSLSKTLLFEYRSIAELCGYFLESHGAALNGLFARAAAAATPAAATATATAGATASAAPASTMTQRLLPPRTATAPVSAARQGAASAVPATAEAIAIIGLSGRYPESPDLAAYWNNLREGRDCIVEVPRERWDWREHFSADRSESGRHYSRWGGFIEGVDEFDPQFFNISPREARYIDPQERLFLQQAWMAVEDAGYCRSSLRGAGGDVGVYAGVMYSEYQLFGVAAEAQSLRMGFSGNVASIANRVSYALDLHGPSMTLDTMCSSSLTAIHVACQDLRQGRTRLAIAGGVNITIHPQKYLLLSVGQFISSDGHCQSFGEGGDGYIPGEGVGAVVLKRLSDAQRDGDHIYGVIRGSALSHGGRTNGYTVPNPQAQTSAIALALGEARVDARHISYIEAHGTGTKLGDPIEIAALNKAFGQYTQDKQYCLIGSAKSNIGHCEAAAGIAGLTKVLLQLKHRQIVPSLHSRTLNPHIDFGASPFIVNQELTDWAAPVVDGQVLPRIAGISSFGAGGSNAHMIIEEFIAPAPAAAAAEPALVVLSARTPEQLQRKAADLLAHLERTPSVALASVAYTLQTGREALDERIAIVAETLADLTQKLRAFGSGDGEAEALYQGHAKRHKEALSLFSTDSDLQQTLGRWLSGRKLEKLAELWVKGLDWDWNALYAGAVPPPRLSLPAYPFARERHWLELPQAGRSAGTAALHPLLQANTSDLYRQSFASQFRGDERFCTPQRSLQPGAYLEMARAALAQAARSGADVLELQAVAWLASPVLSREQPLTITLQALDESLFAWEISSADGDGEVLHCQGEALLPEAVETPLLPLAELQMQLRNGGENQWQGEGERLQRLQLDAADRSDADAYALHPGLLQQALHAVAQLAGGEAAPLALDCLRVLAPLPPDCWLWLRAVAPNGAGAALCFDLDLCDDQGQVCAQLHGLACAAVTAAVERGTMETEAPAAAPVRIALQASAGAAAAAPMPLQKHKPRIQLPSPGAIVAAQLQRHQAVTPRPRISLDTAPVLAAAGKGEVSLVDLGGGIVCLRIDAGSNVLDAALTDALLRALAEARSRDSLRVLLLAGSGRDFLHGDSAQYNLALQRGLHEAIIAFPYPIIAALAGSASGAGWWLASLCDLLLCSEEGHYGYASAEPALAAAHASLLQQRFGNAQARQLLSPPALLTGSALRTGGGTFPVVAGAQVEARALALAQRLANKSAEALRLLKAHLARGLRESVLAAQPADMAAQPAAAGVARVIRLDQRDLPTVTRQFADTVAQIETGSLAGCIVLASEVAPFDGSETAEQALALQSLIQRAPVAVIAALAGDAQGLGWWLGLCCDALVCSEAGWYGAAQLLADARSAAPAAALLPQRLGAELGREMLLTGEAYSGQVLRQRAPALAVLPADQVLAHATQLAQAFRGPVARPSADVLPAWQTDSADWQAPPVGVVALQSRVVTATARADGVLLVELHDREAKNLFSDALVSGVSEVFAHIAATPYKAVVLTGYDSYFASGGTKESLLAIQAGTVKFTDFKIFHAALQCTVPVIAAMQGHGIGAGWSLGLFADLVIFGEESHYLSPYMNYGFTPGAGATLSVLQQLGLDLARESLLTAHEYTGRELRERGVPQRVLARSGVLAEALALAARIARQPRGQLLNLKRQWSAAPLAAIEDTYRRELAMHEATFVGRADTLALIENRFQHTAMAPRRVAAAPAAAAPVRRSVPVAAAAAVPAAAAAVAAAPPAAPVTAAATNSTGDALAAVTANLRQLLAAELQMPERDIDDEAQFVDLGLDSIIGVTWVRKINEAYRLEIEATRVYSHPTLAQLSRHVRDEAEKQGSLPRSAAPAVVAAAPARAAAAASAQPVHAPATASPQPTPAAARGLRSSATPRPAPRLRALAAQVSTAAAQPGAIAVIGMAGQFPQAANLAQYWRNIATGRDCISLVPPRRWDMDQYYRAGAPAPGLTNSRWMGALEDYDLFDPLFFNISPQEAELMDPQQRLFLQSCWQAIEDAGYNARDLSGSRCGVFAGCTNSDYQQLSPEQRLTAQGFTGNANSILAARISYFLNLQGPCLSIDTACSSSLVAMAHACDSLAAGTSDLALAGGVYVMAGPDMHIKAAQAGMLSTDGRCFTFDQRANGFVPGEGVGVVVLKRLADAQRDNDPIYGVIQGWGVNQDGKTNGITAPNPQSQTRLQQEVYDRFGIDPGSIQLIEAHGTGTKLGDPIEVEALKASFGKYTQKQGYCALGSVKSNIGHCLTAAGIAGFIKLMLALKNRQQPPTIQFEQLNEHIDLRHSPFYVNQQLRDWDVAANERRQAAISSFGFSGTNAHIVVAEQTTAGAAVNAAEPAIVVLSARTAEQLQQKVRDLLAFIAEADTAPDLAALAYTLQVGRQPMDERLSVVVTSMAELAQKLRDYLAGEPVIAELSRGHARHNRESVSLLGQDEDIRTTVVERWVAQGKWSRLADLWVKGLDWEWSRLYAAGTPRRISLPSYPFARERYWAEAAGSESTFADSAAAATALLHPLLHTNTSTLRQQTYRSRFDGSEFFLADHRVRTAGDTVEKVLPGVAYLEMARAAVAQAAFGHDDAEHLELRDVVWLRPLSVRERREVSIALLVQDADRPEETLEFRIYSESGAGQNVHCQGSTLLRPAPAAARLDLESLERQMSHSRMEAPQLYQALAAMGLAYGPAHQSLTAIELGERQLLARLHLPASIANSDRHYVLHPSLMDGALQASVGLMLHGGHLPKQPPVPFALDSARVLAACSRDMIAWVRYAPGPTPDGNTWKLDIDLCDAHATVCVQIRGFALRVLDAQGAMPAAAHPAEAEAGAPAASAPADEFAFYRQLVDAIANNEISIDEAMELG